MRISDWSSDVCSSDLRAESALTPLACLMVDIDHFKRFNDTHGHDAGDAVLRAVGGVLDDALREKDCAFRLGGEEFVLLMPGFAQDQAIDRAIQAPPQLQELRVEHRGEELEIGSAHL